MRAEVVGITFGRGRSPAKLQIRLGDQDAEIPLTAVWRALAQASVQTIDPTSVKRAMRVAILDTDDRPTFATIKPQIRGTLFVRTETKGDSFMPHQLLRRIVRPEHLPLLVGRWMLTVRDKMHPQLPKIKDLGAE